MQIFIAVFAAMQFLLAPGAMAQFSNSSLLSGSSASNRSAASVSTIANLTLCDADLLPPAQNTGPWAFHFCDASGAVARTCKVAAKSYLSEALSAAALRARVIAAALGMVRGLPPGDGLSVAC